MTQRTNQFNFTTQRYTEAEIQALLNDSNYALYTISLSDRFGDLGIIGAAIIDRSKMPWHLDSFLMSCRALGRGVEEAFLAKLSADAYQFRTILIGRFIQTKRNLPARQFLERLKLITGSADDTPLSFEIDLDKIACPSWIKSAQEVRAHES